MPCVPVVHSCSQRRGTIRVVASIALLSLRFAALENLINGMKSKKLEVHISCLWPADPGGALSSSSNGCSTLHTSEYVAKH